jgi:hypothetical protein
MSQYLRPVPGKQQVTQPLVRRVSKSKAPLAIQAKNSKIASPTVAKKPKVEIKIPPKTRVVINQKLKVVIKPPVKKLVMVESMVSPKPKKVLPGSNQHYLKNIRGVTDKKQVKRTTIDIS